MTNRDYFNYNSPGYQVLKGFLVGLNIITAICGLGLVGLGIYGLVAEEFARYSLVIPSSTIGFGAVLFIVSFVGCFGAYSEQKRLLHSYFVGLSVLVFLQVALLVYGKYYGPKGDAILEKAWNDAYTKSPKLLRKVEFEFECCGYKTIYDRAYPTSSKDACATDPRYGFEEACYSALLHSYNEASSTITVVTSVIIFLQALTMSIAWILADNTPYGHRYTEALRNERSLFTDNANGNSNTYGATN